MTNTTLFSLPTQYLML